MKDLSGKRFGTMTVIEFVERRNWNYYWRCRCDCGRETVACSSGLLRTKGGCKSCARSSHGHAWPRTPEYTSWLAMHGRVKGKSEKLKYSYTHVAVCERWNSFENFLADMGERLAGMTLDRIDVMGNYEPSNCRWATWKEQIANRRTRRDSIRT